MYFDTPRDFVDGVYEELVYGDHPLGWDIIGRKETVQAASRDTFLDYIGHWYKPSRMVVGVGGRIGDGLVERVTELLRRSRGRSDRRAARRRRRRCERLPGQGAHEAVRPGAHLPGRPVSGRSRIPTVTC